ncbi:MAG TPA: hypothetical protein VI759_04520 [Dehalococcoidia bacterium]|nr:hypothetical protein [Dehalococcoidia bacterium]
MPKKPRQAHIPRTRKRKARRPGQPAGIAAPGAVAADEAYEDDEDAPSFADEPASLSGLAGADASGPVETRPWRARRTSRLEALRRGREPGTAGGIRTVPGQLPVFERAYLIRELRQIMITAGGLLAIIIVLTILLR